MPFEEPKAPIVRIRKKRVKRKSKDIDIVHLPVRASQQARYSTLSVPPNPQTKGRECCRHCFASCMKIPVCRLICFRCILPKCYSGDGSDDEENDVKDEGYHSQNRRSSEITPPQEGGAEGGADTQEIEMSELKNESTKLIPPPRTSVNDYRREPCNESDSKKNGEVTYIEVDSVSLSDKSAFPSIPAAEEDDAEASSEVKLENLERGYEEPLKIGALEFPILKSLGNSNLKEGSSADDDDDDESRVYINESVLGIVCDSPAKKNKETTSVSEGQSYSSFGREGAVTHSRPIDVIKSKSDKPHEYVNVCHPENNSNTPLKAQAEVKKSVQNKSSDKLDSKQVENVKKIPERSLAIDTTHEKRKVDETDLRVSESGVKNDADTIDKEKVAETKEKEKLTEADATSKAVASDSGAVIKETVALPEKKRKHKHKDADHNIVNKEKERLIDKKEQRESKSSDSDLSSDSESQSESDGDQTKLI